MGDIASTNRVSEITNSGTNQSHMPPDVIQNHFCGVSTKKCKN